MKRIQTITILLFLLLSVNAAYATGINLISSDYHIWGNIEAYKYEYFGDSGQRFFNSYDLYSSHPISHEVTFDDESPYMKGGFIAKSEVLPFSANVFAASFTGGIPPFLPPYHPSLYIQAGSGNDAFADATWHFQPKGRHVNIDLSWFFDAWVYSYGEIWLKDVTQGIDLLYLGRDYFQSEIPFGQDSFHFNLDPTHLYKFRIYAEAESADDATGINIRAKFNVPEPSTVLLLGAGLIGLAGYNRRKLKSN